MNNVVTSDSKGRVTGLNSQKKYYSMPDPSGGVYFQPVPEKEPATVSDLSREAFAELLGLPKKDIVGHGGVTIAPLPPEYYGGGAAFGLSVEVFRRDDSGERIMNYVSGEAFTDTHLFRLV